MTFVFTVYRDDESGYSLISLLMALSIVSILLPFTVYFLQSMTMSSSYEEISVQQFFHFMQDEIMMAEKMTIEPERLLLMIDDEIVTFSKYSTNVRRQVMGTGHDIYLRDIEHLSIEETEFGARIVVTTLTGGMYEKALRFDQ